MALFIDGRQIKDKFFPDALGSVPDDIGLVQRLVGFAVKDGTIAFDRGIQQVANAVPLKIPLEARALIVLPVSAKTGRGRRRVHR